MASFMTRTVRIFEKEARVFEFFVGGANKLSHRFSKGECSITPVASGLFEAPL